MSHATAQTLDGPVTTAQVVVVPQPGDAGDAPALRSAADAIVTRSLDLPPVDVGEVPGRRVDASVLDVLAQIEAGVMLGDERVVVFESGPLNNVPVLAQTHREGGGRLVGLGALALLMTVAAVGLALGATRPEDVVLRAQGAPGALRSAVGAIQAAVLAGSSCVLAGLVGVGLPALAFRLYNGGSDLPDIPLVVPAAVPALLAGLPLAAALLAALTGLLGGGARGGEPPPSDDLAW